MHYEIDSETTVLAFEHQPRCPSRGQIVLLHGLEGSADAGYIKSLSQAALLRGFGVHRLNLRTCGGTENLCQTMYHSGLTEDTWTVIRRLKKRFEEPVFLVGFSLGGNVALKLAGEYNCDPFLTGICSISAPIDLASSVRAIDKFENILYARRFLNRLKGRIRRKSLISPGLYQADGLEGIRSIWQFDDHFTAPLFGFGSAAHYYATQSAQNYLAKIRIPGLLITAKDDPLVPFRIYEQCSPLHANPTLRLVAPKRGGHLGFLSRLPNRFWVDGIILGWIDRLSGDQHALGTHQEDFSSV